MKTFESHGKINFVDEANVLVGFDYSQCCCENFGHFFSRKVPAQIEDGAENINADGFNFDTKFFHEATEADVDCGGMVTFRLSKDAEEIFLTLYNSHNGYYSHGFEMAVGGSTIHEGSL